MNAARRVKKNKTKAKQAPSISPAKKKKILEDYTLLFKSRLASNHIRRDVLSGKAKFGIESAGKELLQLALADNFEKGDFYSGYYRDQTFMMKMGLATVADIFAALYGDTLNDKFSGGRQMNGHFATPFLDNKEENWLPLTEQYNVSSAISSLAGQVPRALGLALASKKFRESNWKRPNFSKNGKELSYCIIGDAATSEGVFFEAVNAACVMQVPIIFVVQDDGYGISVPVEMQTAKSSISEALKGFQRNRPNEKACEIYTVRAWDYEALQETFAFAAKIARKEHVPCIVHVTEVTQGNGHSTSGSHERYKSKDRLAWEKEKDCLVQFEKWMLARQYASEAELAAIKLAVSTDFKKEKNAAWKAYQEPFQMALKEVSPLIAKLAKQYPENAKLQVTYQQIVKSTQGAISHLLLLAEQALYSLPPQDLATATKLRTWLRHHREELENTYKTNLYSATDQAAIKVAVHPVQYTDDSRMVNGYEILNHFFDQVLERDKSVYAFGEDVGVIGGVNQGFAGLQEKYGEDRVFDTSIREWTIAGQAIGLAMRGLRPIAEIQYLDYLVYALPALTDDLATLRWRTNGIQKSPVIIRTRGHRLEGIWHSGSPMGMLLGSLRGMYLLTPRNMTQAVGLYNTMLQSDDPAILIEPLNGYRKKEKLPDNLDTFTVPLGSPEVLTVGEDITLVTYGACVAFAQEAVEQLKAYDIQVELIDVQTLLPFDLEHQILESIKKTSRVIFFDEDVPGGGTAYMMREVLEGQGAFRYLDAMPVTIAAKAHRAAFGDDGNYASKPGVLEVVTAAIGLMQEAEPVRFGHLLPLI